MKNSSIILTLKSAISSMTIYLLSSMILFLFFTEVHAQTSRVYIKLTDGAGQQIKGDAVTKGFERWIEANTINSGGKNNTEFSFTMNISGASASFKKALTNGELLLNGQATVISGTNTAGIPLTGYTIVMEKISVKACSEAMGCNNVMSTSVTLNATRIGWTYYQSSRGGIQTVSNKYGWDAEANTAWTNF